MKPKELIKILEADGWQLIRVRGSHHIYKHTMKSGMLIVPYHTYDMKDYVFTAYPLCRLSNYIKLDG